MEDLQPNTNHGRQTADHLCVLIHGSFILSPRLSFSPRADDLKALGQPKSSILPRVFSSRQISSGEAAYTRSGDQFKHLYLRWN